jgi:autotransporter-associated beta strand protein
VADGSDAIDLEVSVNHSEIGINKSGVGTLALLNTANSMGLGITIHAGTLEIGGAGRLQSGGYVNNIANNGTFSYNSTATQTLSGIISGTGALTKSNTSTLTLSGNNTYTGTTTINVGTLIIGNGLTAGSLNAASAITVNSTLAFNRSDDITQGTHFSTAAIGGTGSIVQNGAGTLTLNTANNYSGGTTLNTGTLVIGHANAAGSASINQTSGSSLLKIDTTGTITNAMSVFNVQASQSATLSGAITVNNATWDVDAGDTLTVSGNLSGTGGTTKNGTGTLVLSGNNSNTGATTVNAGTLNAAGANALGSTSSVVVSNGGSLLVTAGDSINDSAGVTLAGGTLAVNGTFNESVGLLTLSANSIIDLGGFTGTLRFGGVGSWASNTTLAIWNWNGINQSGTAVGNGANNRHVVFSDNSGLGAYLDRISFYSDNGSSFAGTGFEEGFSGGGTEIIAVPEPETWATGILLVLASGIWLWRKRTQAA